MKMNRTIQQHDTEDIVIKLITLQVKFLSSVWCNPSVHQSVSSYIRVRQALKVPEIRMDLDQESWCKNSYRNTDRSEFITGTQTCGENPLVHRENLLTPLRGDTSTAAPPCCPATCIITLVVYINHIRTAAQIVKKCS